MADNIQVIIANAKRKATAIIGSTGKIREAFSDGRPNSSPESTVDGTLRAFEALVTGDNPFTEKR